ncbi:diguanylate cyclase [Bordetella genomosp. 1]|uniref:diguanylate cyclase n=1 Tax=Bordetella genomosp. 1 TaxID=1395607 RepID=A0A261SVV1_9BORD|nr:diguanylate cyclase [Bordetella genomosp. 1]
MATAPHRRAATRRLPGLLAILVTLTVLGVGVGFYSAFFASYDVQQERALAHAERETQAYAEKLSQAIGIYLAALDRQADASAQALRQADSPEATRRELERLRRQVDGSLVAMLIDADGKTLAVSPAGAAAEAPGPATDQTPDTPSLSVTHGSADRAMLTLRRRIDADAPAHGGATLVVQVGLEQDGGMQRLIADPAAGTGMQAFLQSADARVLYLYAAGAKPLPLDMNAAIARPGARVVASRDGDLVVGYAPIAVGKESWTVVARQPVQAIMAPVRSLLGEAVRRALAPALLTLLTVVALSYAVAAPLRRLAAVLEGRRHDEALPRGWYREAQTLSIATQATLAQHRHEVSRLDAQRHTDPLTGLANRRALDAALAQWDRDGQGGAFIALDLDHFKRINDTHGHAAGDRVLVAVAGIIKRAIRAQDVAFRAGGEEFLVLLPTATQAIALDVAQRLRQSVAAAAIEGVGHVSISGGVAGWTPADGDIGLAVQRADEALYAAKRAGRDRIEVWAGAP